MPSIHVQRSSTRIHLDKSRVIVKPFQPSGGEHEDGTTRMDRIITRIFALDEDTVRQTLDQTLSRFAHRHRDFVATLESNFAAVAHLVPDAGELSTERRRLIGSYFTHEYSLEAAALSNPSVVLAPDQSGLSEGQVRLVISLRAIGEGHISSIEFRTAIVEADGSISIDQPGPYPTIARHKQSLYVKDVFREKLIELRVFGELAADVLHALGDEFTIDELNASIDVVNHREDLAAEATRATRAVHWLAASNYESVFREDSLLSERVLFPAGPTESSGMEDARFVRFINDDESVTYFATYTAYDGFQILPQLIESEDLLNFRIATLNGGAARNKGIALFPRKINGRYAALARLDNENNFFMSSDNVHFWHESQIIQRPLQPWEVTHIGNCGSPLETEAGWLVITHGVGPMRQYSLGAILLDLNEPSRVIGSLKEPLLQPNQEEREGYVPNVVYSCGSVIVGDHLILPYGFSDCGTGLATVKLSELLSKLTSSSSAIR